MDDKYFGWFGDKKHKFYIEMRCGKPVVAATPLCGRCHERPKENHKYQAKPLHGLVTESLPPWSHIFGGIWYQAKVAEYGLPSEEEMGRAKKAHQDIIDSLTTNLVVMPLPTPSPSIQIPLDIKLKNELVVPSPSLSTKSEEKPKDEKPKDEKPKDEKPKRKYVRKQNIGVAPVTTVAHTVPTLAIEANEPIQCDIEVTKRVVRKIVHDGITYFLDPVKEKVYSAGIDGRPLAYVGRWNTRNQTIHTDISDSEEEN